MQSSTIFQTRRLTDPKFNVFHLSLTFMERPRAPLCYDQYQHLARQIEFLLLKQITNPPQDLSIDNIVFTKMTQENGLVMTYEVYISLNQKCLLSNMPKWLNLMLANNVVSWYTEVKGASMKDMEAIIDGDSVLMEFQDYLWKITEFMILKKRSSINEEEEQENTSVSSHREMEMQVENSLWEAQMEELIEKNSALEYQNFKNKKSLGELVQKCSVLEEKYTEQQIENQRAQQRIRELETVLNQRQIGRLPRPCCYNACCDFRVFGLSHQATRADLETRYKDLSLQEHPDKNWNSRESTERFQQLGTIRDRLKNKLR